MRVFLSWSGLRSSRVASHLRAWLTDVMPVVVQPWMSEADIAAGKRWGRELDGQLAETSFGIVCLTGSNQTAPWLLFEAGALAKSVSEANVCPYLIDLEPKDLTPGPLTQFQCKQADKEGTWGVLRSINTALADTAFDEGWLRKHFEKWWPELETALRVLPPDAESSPIRRSADEMLIEVLEIARRLDTVEMPTGGWPTLLDEMAQVRENVMALRQLGPAARRNPRRRQIRLLIEYQRSSGGLATLSVPITSDHTVFDALTEIWGRLRSSDSALKPPPYTYMWDWIMIRKDGLPLVAGGIIYTIPATIVFESETNWSAERLETPLLNSAHWLNVVRGQPQV